MDNIKTWTGLSVEESIRMTEDRDKWRKYVHGVANPRIEDGLRTGSGGRYTQRDSQLRRQLVTVTVTICYIFFPAYYSVTV